MQRDKRRFTAMTRPSLMEPLSFSCRLGECRSELLPLLSEVSKVVSAEGSLSKTLKLVLELMQKHLQVIRAMITLYDASCDQIFIHESYGLSREEADKGVYAPGEGITGRVIETRQPIIVPNIADDPLFLNRTGSWNQHRDGQLSFICVPIIRSLKVMGTIGIERLYHNEQLRYLDVEVLRVIAAIIAQAVELHLLERAHQKILLAQASSLRQQREKFKPANIIGNSRAMQSVYQLIDKVSHARTTVLILGESGVGKERVATALHQNSHCANGPFIKFNCASLPESVIESELFGHEKGAFTGAISRRAGRFEEADGGTLFLDEVGELSPSAQSKLLRVLQERSFERVGSNETIQVNVRILAATHRDLSDMVEKRLFREDLFYRLNVFPITIPPLRERGNDILILADHFNAHFATEQGVDIPTIATPALNLLLSYDWPGNVRELENVMERAVLLADEGVIHSYHLPINLQPIVEHITQQDGLEARLSRVEYDLIVEALSTYQGNVSRTAAHLNMTRRALGLRLAKYRLDYKNYRGRA
ncbi:sigma-54 interaction domain-containing protein [Musicola paradisiaca]|uniref:Transcriptional regulator, NifA subfamily, Fis Family n=1 Tax=Musicola paradisiaca (strain Ech703) TaxID=579405 RepID=C6C9X2_MUSP7|nr:sigma 54-interacting transcriptional regulator [Musicola paradisiaca]ACS86394.1 transcriptional regulator, NifA subfamily, Fis Family [Musicola paradisiaca Ech703]